MSKLIRLLKSSLPAMRGIGLVGWILYCLVLIVYGNYLLVIGLSAWPVFSGYATVFWWIVMLLVAVILSIHNGGPSLRRRIDQIECDLAYLEANAVLQNSEDPANG